MRASMLHVLMLGALAVAWGGCGDDDSGTTSLSLASLVGTYDVELRAADGRSATALGVVVVDEEGRIEIRTDLDGTDAGQFLRGAPPTGATSFSVEGSEGREDTAADVRGTLAFSAGDDRLTIRGSVDDGGEIFSRSLDAGAAGPIALSMVRPLDGVPRFLRGTQTVRLTLLPSPSGTRVPSTVRLVLDVRKDGTCISAPATEEGGEARSRFEAGICQLSPAGRFRLGMGFEPIPPNGAILVDSPGIWFTGRLRIAGSSLVGEGFYSLPAAISPVRGGDWRIER